jgi:hypothetical protein
MSLSSLSDSLQFSSLYEFLQQKAQFLNQNRVCETAMQQCSRVHYVMHNAQQHGELKLQHRALGVLIFGFSVTLQALLPDLSCFPGFCFSSLLR